MTDSTSDKRGTKETGEPGVSIRDSVSSSSSSSHFGLPETPQEPSNPIAPYLEQQAAGVPDHVQAMAQWSERDIEHIATAIAVRTQQSLPFWAKQLRAWRSSETRVSREQWLLARVDDYIRQLNDLSQSLGSEEFKLAKGRLITAACNFVHGSGEPPPEPTWNAQQIADALRPFGLINGIGANNALHVYKIPTIELGEPSASETKP